MNICIYTVHLFLYECITCKEKSCLSNYCTFLISYVTTKIQNSIHEKKKSSWTSRRSCWSGQRFSSTSHLMFSIAMHRGEKSPWMLHPSPVIISCDVLTCSIHVIQQRHLILWSVIIYFPPPCWKTLLLDLGMRVWWKELHCYPFMCSKPVPNNVGSVEADIIPDNNIIRQMWSK